jgi:hypothetical protein
VTLTSSPESWTDKFRPVCLVPAWQFMLPEYRYYMFVFRKLAVQPVDCASIIYHLPYRWCGCSSGQALTALVSQISVQIESDEQNRFPGGFRPYCLQIVPAASPTGK